MTVAPLLTLQCSMPRWSVCNKQLQLPWKYRWQVGQFWKTQESLNHSNNTNVPHFSQTITQEKTKHFVAYDIPKPFWHLTSCVLTNKQSVSGLSTIAQLLAVFGHEKPV